MPSNGIPLNGLLLPNRSPFPFFFWNFFYSYTHWILLRSNKRWRNMRGNLVPRALFPGLSAYGFTIPLPFLLVDGNDLLVLERSVIPILGAPFPLFFLIVSIVSETPILASNAPQKPADCVFLGFTITFPPDCNALSISFCFWDK